MTLKYHYSPNAHTWTRCVAQTPDNCPFGAAKSEHADRTGIAHDHGGIIAGNREGEAKETTVTPVVGGVYAVFTPNGDARTYDRSGALIPARKRRAYLEDVILPELASEQSAKDDELGLTAELRKRLAERAQVETFEQIKLPALTFAAPDTDVVINRAAPRIAGPVAPGTATGWGVPTPAVPPRSSPVMPQVSPNAPLQSAPVMPQAKRSAPAPAPGGGRRSVRVTPNAKTRRRLRAVRRTQRAIRLYRSYNRTMNRVAKPGSAPAPQGKADILDGFLGWFFLLFDLD